MLDKNIGRKLTKEIRQNKERLTSKKLKNVLKTIKYDRYFYNKNGKNIRESKRMNRIGDGETTKF